MKDHSFVEIVHKYDINIGKRIIYLFGNEDYIGTWDEAVEPGVDFAMANRLIRNITTLQDMSNDNITIYMKTSGGYWEEGMAIYDAIKACKAHVTIIAYAHARSMSSIILQAADYRVIMPNCIFMFHEGTVDFSGTVKQLHSDVEQVKNDSRIMMEIYIDAMKEKGKMSNLSRKDIREWLVKQMEKKEEVYLNAKQTVEHGFADVVMG